MLTEERYGKILSLLEEQGSVKVTELMQLSMLPNQRYEEI